MIARSARKALALASACALTACEQEVPVIALEPASETLTAQFTVIGSVRELSDGRVLVDDDRENRIVVVDPRSGTVTDIGRVGQGPGEYNKVGRLWALGGDSTLMSDRFVPRWLLLDGAQIVATLSLDSPAMAPARRGSVQGTSRDGPVLMAVLRLNPYSEDSAFVAVLDRARMHLDTIGQMGAEFGGATDDRASGEAEGAAVGGPPKYSMAIIARDQLAMFPDGWVAIARVDPYRVDWCDPAGKCARGRPLPFKSARFTDREKQSYLDVATKTNAWPPTTNLGRTAGWPAMIPPFVIPTKGIDVSAVLASPDGRVVIERLPSADEPRTRHDVIDRAGSLVGRILLPLNERIVGFGERSVYVAVTDSDDIQRLRRHPWP